MRKYILGLFAVAVLGGSPALAQTQPSLPVTHGAPGASGQTQSSGPITQVAPSATGQTAAPVVHGGMLLDQACNYGPQTQTVCVPEQYMKKTTKTCYNSGCEPLCVCYWLSLCGCCGGGGGCDSGFCEHPYTRRYLIMKVRTCEECCTKCVPREVPCCAGSPCLPVAGGAAPIVPSAYAAPTSLVINSGAALSGPVVHQQKQ
jgi:hypothetical protein